MWIRLLGERIYGIVGISVNWWGKVEVTWPFYTMSTPLLQVSHIVKSFGTAPVLRDVSFDVAPGEILCLLGPSGCGKTTLLYIVAGLEQAGGGQVLIEGRDASGMPVHQRGFGLMFQDLALFPHKNVRDNVAFGLRMANLPRQAIDARVSEVLALVGLAGFEARNVNQLSGGEQQRVALARSLAPRPRLLMLDEPLGSLDRTLRERLMNELRGILKQLGQTALYVTHDQQEAFALADRVVIMGAGRVLQEGIPSDVYRHPASARVAQFLGMSNLVPGRVVSASAQAARVQTALGQLEVTPGDARRPQSGDDVIVLIRPEAAILGQIDNLPDERPNHIAAALVSSSFRGSRQYAIVQVSAIELTFELDAMASLPPPGAAVSLGLARDAMTCLPANA
jgi:ABC-type Fe3+/spermidine/putrescine transport system ATPase subunit